jgi:RNA 2',3'-cyclic 3'-phosphodiesterase
MAGSEQLRLFIAVAIPEDIKAKLAEAQAELRRAMPEHGVRWTPREQLHLTLRFLGDVEKERVEALGEALRAACRAFGALHLRAERVGFFPNLHRPRVAWAGVHDREERLPVLQQTVDAATREFTAEPKEERFTGHVTLARIKAIRRPEAEALGKAAAALAESFFGQWTIGHIELMRSVLSPHGATHSMLEAVALADSARGL